jgi:hypothetical protein
MARPKRSRHKHTDHQVDATPSMALIEFARLLARMAARETFASTSQDVPENDDAATRS